MITPEEKRLILKEVAILLKEFRGAGPQSHFIIDTGSELEIVVSGTLSTLEKYMFNKFGLDYFDAVKKFYYEALRLAVERLDYVLHNKYQFKLIGWEPDFSKDKIKYIVQYIP